MVSNDRSLKRFFYQSLAKAENPVKELEIPQVSGRGYFKLGRDKYGALLDFYVKQPPESWSVGVEKIDAGNSRMGGDSTVNVYLQGCLRNISKDSSAKVARSLPSLLGASDNCTRLDALKAYDIERGTFAVLKSAPNGKMEEYVLSNKEPRIDILREIRHSYGAELKEAMLPGLGMGVSIVSDNASLVSIMRDIIEGRNAQIKELAIGLNPPVKLRVDMDVAKRFVFNTPLKGISHADVNCMTDNGVMSEYDASKGAVYVSDGDLRIKTRTADKLKDVGGVFLLSQWEQH